MCCFFTALVFFGPRLGFLVYWLIAPVRVSLAFADFNFPFLVSLLGLIFRALDRFNVRHDLPTKRIRLDLVRFRACRGHLQLCWRVSKPATSSLLHRTVVSLKATPLEIETIDVERGWIISITQILHE